MNQVKKIDAATLSEMNAEQAKMQTAFALVSPDTQGRNWKDKIDCYVSGKSPTRGSRSMTSSPRSST